jgi:hypothetical protein
MGYTTDFDGKFNLDRPLSPEHSTYLTKFAQTRRMQRNTAKAATLPDAVREAAGLPIGEQGGYFVGATDFMGQEPTPDVTDGNHPPTGQPGLWCQWIPTEDGSAIEWDGGEKFYDYTDWIIYLITHFLKPWGYVLNGAVDWQGEERGDIGRILIVNNAVSIKAGKVVYK